MKTKLKMPTELFLEHSDTIWLRCDPRLSFDEARKIRDKIDEILISSQKPAEKMVWYKYTTKAIKNGCYETRVMLVDGEPYSKLGKRRFSAWKFDLTKDGLSGPISKRLIQPNELNETFFRQYLKDAKLAGSEPTAEVVLDSYHREVTWTGLNNLLRETK